MALDVGGEHDRAGGGLPLAGRPAAAGRLLGGGVPRRRGVRARRREQPRRLPRRRRLAQLAAHRRRAAGRPSCGRRSAPGLDLVTRMQLPGGAIGWALRPDGTPDDTALLTGNASLFQALRCGIALAGLRGEAQPDWELAVADLGTALRDRARGLRRPVPLLDGLVLPGARRRGHRRRRPATGWPPTGTGSSSPAWAPAASPTGRG